jgi:hypothetical protein
MFSLLVFALSVLASPNGAPGCKINTEVINRGMGEQIDMGYTIQVRPGTTPTSFTVQINNTQGRADYQGLLIYVTTLADTNVHYGKWTFRNETKWKYQNLEACQRANVTGFLESTFTHAMPARVPTSVLFTWAASSIQEAAIPGLIVSAAIAANEPGVLTTPRWQRLEQTPIGTGGSATTAPGGSPTVKDVAPSPGASSTSSASTVGGSLLFGLLPFLL